MKLIDSHSGLERLEGRECLRLLATKEIGRLGFLSGGYPEILPVNFVLDGEAVMFATDAGTKLDGATRSPVVFEVDDTDAASRTGWSVIIHGMAEEVTESLDPSVVDRVRLLLRPWAGYKAHLVRISARYVTGRVVGPTTTP
jgi:hypothetical protein